MARSLLCFLCVLAAALGHTTAFKTVHLPAVDFPALHEDGALLDKLRRLGTIAVRGVPGYADLRRRYLVSAAACVRARPPEGVLHRVMDDGTERFTLLSLQGEREPLPSAACPEFHAAKREFSALVERTVEKLSAAIDRRIADAYGRDQAVRLSQVVASGRHMDHFHAYMPRESTSMHATAVSAAGDSPWTLNMHSDLGVLIAMAAPAFFEVVTADGGAEALVPVANPDPDSGLILKTPAGEAVRPEQPADSLIVMAGDGFSAWTGLPVAVPAVVHGVAMPATCHARPLLRAWFGKMVLPARDFTLRSTNETFGAFSDRVSEHFSDLDALAQRSLAEPQGFASAACAGLAPAAPASSTRLLLDAPTCAYRVCEPIVNRDYKESCSLWCNLARTANNAAKCATHCRCSQNLLRENVFLCWSGCFEFSRACAHEFQTCIGESDDPSGYATVQCAPTALTDDQRQSRARMDTGADFSRFPTGTDEADSGSASDSSGSESASSPSSGSDNGMSGMSGGTVDSDGASTSGDGEHEHEHEHVHASSMASMSGMRN